jgi:hypothetical protein
MKKYLAIICAIGLVSCNVKPQQCVKPQQPGIKISELPLLNLPKGSVWIPVVQNGVTYKMKLVINKDSVDNKSL